MIKKELHFYTAITKCGAITNVEPKVIKNKFYPNSISLTKRYKKKPREYIELFYLLVKHLTNPDKKIRRAVCMRASGVRRSMY